MMIEREKKEASMVNYLWGKNTFFTLFVFKVKYINILTFVLYVERVWTLWGR